MLRRVALVAAVSIGCSAGERTSGIDAVRGDGSASSADAADAARRTRVLVFTRTQGYRHESIPDAVRALGEAARSRGWALDATEDATWFDDERLGRYDVVAFVLTSGDVLDGAQEAALTRFVQSGKGWVGVHSASDTEYEWPWYGELVGSYFSAHPAVQAASLRVERRSHLATQHLGATWTRTDEWYGFQSNPRSEVNVLLSVDESSLDAGAGAMGDHPVAWYHGHDGGRAFYTALGHTAESWNDPDLVEHVAGGIEWAAGREWDRIAAVDFDGVEPAGVWDAQAIAGGFRYEVTQAALRMFDEGGATQHVLRRGVALDANRPYAIEGLFIVPAGDDGSPNSFCFDLCVAGPDGDPSPPSTWGTNVDFSAVSPGGVMKHLGFVGGVFDELGETSVAWPRKGVEYLLHVDVGVAADGRRDPNRITVDVSEAGVPRERFDVDYTTFPYQPARTQPVRFGVNTEGTDWVLRSVRVYYLD